MGWLRDETGLDKNAANYVALSPLSFLQRAVTIYPQHPATIYGKTTQTYQQYYTRITKLAAALSTAGIQAGDVVSTLLPNIPQHAEAHFAIPATGAVINAINTRLDVSTVAYIFDHSECKIVLCDSALVPLAEEATAQMDGAAPRIIEVVDLEANCTASGRHDTYEDFLAKGDDGYAWVLPQDEWESIALNYTSGTTGRPKGVVYHHRGAYLNAMGQVISLRMVLHPVYLAIVPLFHCNNWCHTWMMPVIGGTFVGCRDITAKNIYDAIRDHGVTHFSGAPIVLNMIVNAKEDERRPFDHIVEVGTAGAPPAAATLAAIEPLGFNVTQLYGLTETYGPAVECYWNDEQWGDLQGEARAAMKARTGIAMPFMEPIQVWDSAHNTIPMDGEATGEVVFRGNGVMKGYFKNPQATAEAFAGGMFHSGDIAKHHPDSYIQIADRAKDIIISGGENISSVEVEGVLMGHPAVSLCSVVAKPDEKWGEVPCAFIELKDGADVSEEELNSFARSKLAGFKTPKDYRFQELPKTSTGKIQKFELRKQFKT